jgi:hypothetical protein
MDKTILTDVISEPLNGVKTARFDINAGDGNLTIDRLASDEPVLASGELQYSEKQGPPVQCLNTTNGHATLMLKGGRSERLWFHLPWAANNAATEWQVHLNPAVLTDLTAHSDGGNVRLDLFRMAISRVSADTGGGNVVVILPDEAANLDVTARTGGGDVFVEIGKRLMGSGLILAKSGAGNVAVSIPGDQAARIHVTSGLGKVIVDPCFNKIDTHTYQTPDFDQAANKVEITADSGAGNVSIEIR